MLGNLHRVFDGSRNELYCRVSSCSGNQEETHSKNGEAEETQRTKQIPLVSDLQSRRETEALDCQH